MLDFKTCRTLMYTFFIFITIMLLVINITLIDYDLGQLFLINVLDLIVSAFIIMMIYLLIKKAENLNGEKELMNNILNTSPLYFIYSDDGQNISNISQGLRHLLRRENIKIRTFKKLSPFFSIEEWERIENLINNPQEEITTLTGDISLTSLSADLKYVKYYLQVQKIEDKTVTSLWLLDVSKTKDNELKVIEHVYKYRNFSYILDTIVNNLPLPIWKMNQNNNIEYYNDNLIHFLKEHKFIEKDDENAIIEAINNLLTDNNGAISNNTDDFSIQKHLFKNDEPKYYSVNMHKLPYEQGFLGYIKDIENELEDGNETQNKYMQLQKAYNQLLGFVNEPLIVVKENGNLSYLSENFTKLIGDKPKDDYNFTMFLNDIAKKHNFSDEDIEYFKAKMQKCFHNNDNQSLEVQNETVNNIRMIYLNNKSVMVIFNNKNSKGNNYGEANRRNNKKVQ